MKVLALLLGCGALVACDSGSGDYPIQPGGGTPPGTSTQPDGGAGGDAAGATISGRVCKVTDLRAHTSGACATTGAGGITVTLGASTAETDATGAFTIATPTGTNLVWRASGVDLVGSVMPLGGANQIPIIDTATYEELLLSAGALLSSAQGSIIGYVRRAGQPLAGAIADVTPVPPYPAAYDGTTASVWRADATGAFGTVWVPAIDAGSVTVTVTPTVSTAVTRTVLVEEVAITFVPFEIP